MKSLFDFIVEPYGQRYNNKVKVGDKSLIINTKIESFKLVNNIAKVIEIPLSYKTVIQKGDLIMIHHNVFRRWHNIRGEEKNSKSYFQNGLYFVQQDQIYLYKRKDKWNSFNDRCFIAPLKDNVDINNWQEQSLVGILKYGNKSLEALKITPGDLVGYTPGGEWEFLIDKERIYCMKSNDIVIKYEYKGNEEEYNPSWACSS